MCRTSPALRHLSPIQVALNALNHLRKVRKGSTLFHFHLSQIRTGEINHGIHLSDIGTSEREISKLCNIGSKNVLAELAKILTLSKEFSIPSDIISVSIMLEAGCGYVTRQDLKELGLTEFTKHIPSTEKGDLHGENLKFHQP